MSDTLRCQRDYLRVLAEVGKSHQWVLCASQNTTDQCALPEGFSNLWVLPSPIEGLGVFTSTFIKIGEVVGPARLNSKRTWLGRYVNHSPTPNSAFKLLPNGDLETVALCDIQEGTEILNDYRVGAQLAGEVLNPNEVAITLAQR